jgi:hypothetical protein
MHASIRVEKNASTWTWKNNYHETKIIASEFPCPSTCHPSPQPHRPAASPKEMPAAQKTQLQKNTV